MPPFHDPHGRPLEIDVDRLVVAGWAGRDQAAVDRHIRELAELGVPAPSQVPLYYRVAANQLTTAETIQVVGDGTSGEAEAVLLSHAGGLYVAVGSDHTDRDAEAYTIALAKQACAKPLGPHVWPFDAVADHWDSLQLRAHAWIDGERTVYQDGTLAELRRPSELIDGFGGLPAGSAMFCGTIPTLHGLKPAARFEVALHDPVLGRTLTHAYDIEVLPLIK
jgi:hypothetical protein